MWVYPFTFFFLKKKCWFLEKWKNNLRQSKIVIPERTNFYKKLKVEYYGFLILVLNKKMPMPHTQMYCPLLPPPPTDAAALKGLSLRSEE